MRYPQVLYPVVRIAGSRTDVSHVTRFASGNQRKNLVSPTPRNILSLSNALVRLLPGVLPHMDGVRLMGAQSLSAYLAVLRFTLPLSVMIGLHMGVVVHSEPAVVAMWAFPHFIRVLGNK